MFHILNKKIRSSYVLGIVQWKCKDIEIDTNSTLNTAFNFPSTRKKRKIPNRSWKWEEKKTIELECICES